MLPSANHDLPHSTPESQGIDSTAILRLIEAFEQQIDEFHSLMLLRHGQVVAAGWWSPYRADTPHVLFSLSKSFTATAVGLAVNEGYFSVEDVVLGFFPDEAPTDNHDLWAEMRVRHLLTMATGQATDTWAPMKARHDGNWIKAFFEVPVRYPPGTHFLYNTGATYMLSAIVQKTTGLKVVDYLRPRLLAPLGIQGVAWQDSPQGITMGGIGLSATTEAIARFGQLYLQGGMWQGQRILPASWVTEATAFQVSNGTDTDSDWAQGYGYQFWRSRHGAYRGDGAFGQYCIVMPEQDAVLVMTGGLGVLGMQPPLDLVWEILLPAMGERPRAEDATAQGRLTEKLDSLHLPTVHGRVESPWMAVVSGRTYQIEANTLGMETITLDFGPAGCTVTIKTATSTERFDCGYGRWQTGQTDLFYQPWWSPPTPIMVSGAWAADDHFSMLIRLNETPFYHTLNCHFIGDELMIETRINTSFDSLQPLLLTARMIA